MPIHLLDTYHQQKHQLQMNQRHRQHQRPAANMTNSNSATASTTSPSSSAYSFPNSSSSSSSSFSLSSSSSSSLRPLFRSYLILTYMLIIARTALVMTEAKPLSQYQVRFRRVPPKEFSAALGSSITIECEAGASPPPTMHWLKDGKRIVQNEADENRLDEEASGQSFQVDGVSRISLSTSRSRLYIDCADFVDEATYTCVAENAYSRISSQTKLNLIKPIVQAVSGGSNENDLVTDEVAALGDLASPSAASAALKALNGANENGPKALTAMPQCLSDRMRLGSSPQPPARIHMWTHNIVEIMKNNVVLMCRSNIKRAQQDINLISGNSNQEAATTSAAAQSSSNKPLVSWTLPDDKPVSEDQKDKYEVLENGDLLIKNLGWSDMGSYVCTVSDEQSSDSISSFVYPASVKATNSKRAVSGISTGRLTRFR